MKKLVMILALVPCLALATGTLSALKVIEKDADEGVINLGNGGVYLSKFVPGNFDLDTEVAKIKAEIRREKMDCKFKVFTGRRAAIDMIASNEWTKAPRAAAILRRLYNNDEILAIVSKVWDEASGDSEYCAKFEFDIYTTDGNKLSLDFDITD